MKDALLAAERASMNKILPPELFSGLLAIAADAVIAVDEEQRIIFFNEGAERIFGWTAGEVGGQSLEMLLPERYRASHRGHVQGFGAGHGRARLMGDRQQISGLRKSGEEFACEAAIERLSLGGRSVYATVLRDISARQRAEDLLHQAIRARDDVMGIVSHDLRNPANAVKMLAKSILESHGEHDLDASVIERIFVIRQAAEQIDALIQDLLDIARLEGGPLLVDAQPTDVALVFARSIDALRPLADASGVVLHAAVHPPGLRVYADSDRVTQLLSNIIGNAIKFTAHGGDVELVAHPKGEDVVFVVTDTGTGIDPEHLPHVFERFFQANATGRRGSRQGAGLGLPIARGIVEAHGGRIWVDSAPSRGTTVCFTLRRVGDEDTTAS
jgi:PAS domain S-box-containing protein